MFKITDRPKFSRSVLVLVPEADGSRKETLRATYQAMPSSEADKYDVNTAEGTRAFLRVVLIHVDDIADEHGKALPYSDAVRDQLIDLPWARNALAVTYFDEVGKAREGN